MWEKWVVSLVWESFTGGKNKIRRLNVNFSKSFWIKLSLHEEELIAVASEPH